MDIAIWVEAYLEKLKALFGTRLEFAGLQGSYGRGEATDESDIDAVVILDRAAAEDLLAYGAMLDTLPHRDKACGFISGRREIESWERSDLFQFYRDTTPLLGSLDFLRPLIGPEDVRRAVRIGACNFYHACGHNLVHEKSADMLKGLYKAAGFTVQAIAFAQTGEYVRRRDKLLPALRAPEREILETAIALKAQPDRAGDELEALSARLLNWASGVIAAYAER
jgi:predicted nucleotidyltransferase